MKIQPLYDRVVIRPQGPENMTKSGLYIPDNSKEKSYKGEVVAVGDGKDDKKMTVKVGDSVIYGKYAVNEVTISGDDFLIVKESDILAII